MVESTTANGRKRADGIPGTQRVDGRAFDGVGVLFQGISGPVI